MTNNLRRYRDRAGLTLRGLGDQIGDVSPQTVCDYEHGRRQPGYARMLVIAAVLRTRVDDIWPGDGKGTRDGRRDGETV